MHKWPDAKWHKWWGCGLGHSAVATIVGVEVAWRSSPRVARGSQPWALWRNPFGIQRGASRPGCWNGHAGRSAPPPEVNPCWRQGIGLVGEVAEGALQGQGLGGAGAGLFVAQGVEAGGGEGALLAAEALYFVDPGVGIKLHWGERLVAGLGEVVFLSQPVEHGALGCWRLGASSPPGGLLLSFQPVLPITGPLLTIHHGNNPDPIGLLDVDHGVGKDGGEMAAGGSIETRNRSGCRQTVPINRSISS